MRRIFSNCVSALLTVAILCWAIAAPAQAPGAPSETQFDITGILQAATLNIATANPIATPPAFFGGTLAVNGHTIIVPDNTVVQYPANNTTWAQVFAQAPMAFQNVANRPPQSGLATSDRDNNGLAPFTTYEVHVVGNRVINSAGGPDRYIAGLITFAQESLNSGQGFINYINYTTGDIWVGGTIHYSVFTPINLPPTGSDVPGTRLQINDPLGKHGLKQMNPNVDQRFCLDPDNPTIRSASGYPMGLPTVDPLNTLSPTGVFTGPDDPYRPHNNRVDNNPLALPAGAQPFPALSFTLLPQPVPAPGAANPAPILTPGNVANHPQDSRLQAPLEVGDYVTYSGTLTQDIGGPTPSFIACHTITDNAAIYTMPGNNPAYVAIDVTLLGTGGLKVLGLNETTTRTRFEGFSTDISRNIYLFGMDLNPITGTSKDRDWGAIDTDQGPPTGAARGRWRFRPSNLVKLTPNPKGTGVLVAPSAGNFGKPPREVRAVIAGGYNVTTAQFTDPAWIPAIPGTPAPAWSLMPAQPLYSNLPTSDGSGLISGQYHAPISEYLFPEQLPGGPIPPCNFEVFDWLTSGGQVDSATGNVLTGQLFPWPGLNAPPVFQPGPSLNAGANVTATAGAAVTLTATATDPTGVAFTFPAAWAQTAGPGVALQGETVTTTVTGPAPANLALVQTDSVGFTAPLVPTTLTFTVSATNGQGKPSTSTVTVTVIPMPNDTVVINAVDQRSFSRIDVTATDIPPVNPATGVPYYAVGSQALTAYFYDKNGILLGSAVMAYQPAALNYLVSVLGGAIPSNKTTRIIVRSSGGGASVPVDNTTGKTLGIWKVR